MTYPTFAALAPGYTRLWAGLEPRSEHMPALREICRQLVAHRGRYQAVAQTVWKRADLWFVVALIDQMEHEPARGLCNSHLHNGDSLTHRTVQVPAGRPPLPAKPPFTFQASAVDALRYEGLDQVAVWTVERLAYWLERYNGGGYLNKPVENPYLASWSTAYVAGKYVADHRYSATAVSGQPGALTILKVLIEIDPTIAAVLAPAKPQESPPMTTTSPAPAQPTVLSEIEQVINTVSGFLPQAIMFIANFYPPAKALLAFLPLIQVAIQAVRALQQATGQSTAAATAAVIDHLTPGQPNAPALSPAASTNTIPTSALAQQQATG
jgi:lysozyme family protein